MWENIFAIWSHFDKFNDNVTRQWPNLLHFIKQNGWFNIDKEAYKKHTQIYCSWNLDIMNVTQEAQSMNPAWYSI